MKSKFKVLSLVLACVFLVAALMACAQPAAQPAKTDQQTQTAAPEKTADAAPTAAPAKNPKDIRIFVEHFSKTIEVAMQWRYGALKAGKELGITVDAGGAEDATAEKNIALIEQAIAQKYDGIASIALVSDSYAPVYDKAVEMGIPVCTYHMDAPQSKRLAYFGPNQESYAKAAAHVVADQIGKEGKVITIQGTPSDTESMIIDTFAQELETYAPNCKVITKINDTIDPAKAYEKITAAIQANKDVKGFFSCTSRGGADVAKVCDDLGIKQLSNITMDVVSYNVDLLKQGKITGIVDQGAFMTGYNAVYALYDYIVNGKLTQFKEGPNYNPDMIVTIDTIGQYEEMLKGAQELQKEAEGK